MSHSIIPVIHSIPNSAALITTVLSEYPINLPYSCKLYKRGLNDTYLVEAKDENYILRVYRHGLNETSQHCLTLISVVMAGGLLILPNFCTQR